MRFLEIQDIAFEIVREENRYFISSYQICQKIEERNPELWERICNEYPSENENIEMGAGTGRHYSPASFIANALRYFYESGSYPALRQEYFSCERVFFEETIPGFTGNILGIWAWQE
ncbi:MAG: hypothetical protein RPT25_15455 [Cycloclasticus sp.]